MKDAKWFVIYASNKVNIDPNTGSSWKNLREISQYGDSE